MAHSEINNEQLSEIRRELQVQNPGKAVKAWMIKDYLKAKGIMLDESTIRGRFIEMGSPLSGGGVGDPPSKEKPTETGTTRAKLEDTASVQAFDIPEEMKPYIPDLREFENYIERETDRRLSVHYNTGKHPLSQGKQGTGKTWGHMYYAAKNSLPFFLFQCFDDFKLQKLFGDKTIVNGTIVFQESLFVKAIQCPSVVLFDEINSVSNANAIEFHALLQNRELFIKDANDGKGKLYKLHKDCKIGFAQNPKSAKYIGGNIRASSFLGRCTFITYPDFTRKEIMKALQKRYPGMDPKDVTAFTEFYIAVTEIIDKAKLPLDISIRQINNVVDLWMAGLPLKEAIEDGLASITEAASQPAAKDSLMKVAAAVWQELMK